MSDRPYTLDMIILDARASLEAELARERRDVSPDFAAVVAMAHDRHPSVVSAAALREVGDLAPVIELDFRSAEAGGGEPDSSTLDAWISEARALTEADVARRRLAGIPPLRAARAPASPVSPRRELSWLGLAVALVAVVGGLAVAIPRLLESFVDGNYREASKPNQAEHLEREDNGRSGVELLPAPAPAKPTPLRALTHEAPPPRDRAGRSKPSARPSAKPSSAPAAKAPSDPLRDRVEELEAQAQAQWAAGQLEQAQASYREIIALAGRRRYADLAYGDLFTLAHQRGDAAAELALWREYIGVFPNGRFADDARAGLCRRASASEREACWLAYLADFPKGIHASAATRELSADMHDMHDMHDMPDMPDMAPRDP